MDERVMEFRDGSDGDSAACASLATVSQSSFYGRWAFGILLSINQSFVHKPVRRTKLVYIYRIDRCELCVKKKDRCELK